MTTRPHRFEALARGNRACAVLALVATWVVAPTLSHATPLDYTISGTTSFFNDHVQYNETISGSFTFDAATDTESDVSITLTGTSPIAGTYTQTSPVMLSGNEEIAASGLLMFFASPLDVSPDDLSVVRLPGFQGVGVGDNSPTGSAVFASTTVPEPASIALLGTALVGLGAIRRRRKGRAALSA